MDARETYFVTGGTGFIGGRLIEQLLEDGKAVRALVRKGSAQKLPVKDANLHIVTGDLQNEKALRQGMEGCHGVFHIAGLAKVWAPDDDQFYEVNLRGTQRVLKAAKETGIAKLVFTSTAGVIAPSLHPAHESTQRDIPFFNTYEASKFEAEQLLKAYAQEGLHAVIVNPPRVFGPGQLSTSNAVTKMINQYVFRSWRWSIGDGRSIGNYTFIEDVVNGHLLAMENGQAGERYILGGTNLSFLEFFETLSDVARVHRSIIPIPIWLAMPIARFEKWKADNFGVQPLITPSWLKKYNYNWALTSQKAIDEIGYSITPIEKAFEQTINWLKNR